MFVDRMIALTDGFVEDFGVSATFSLAGSRPLVLIRSVTCLQMDVDHPMNVVEGKDCIVIQVSRFATRGVAAVAFPVCRR